MTEAMADKKAMLAGLHEALWTALGSHDYSLIRLENLAEAAGISPQQAVLVAGSVDRVLLSAIEAIDEAVLVQSATDFGEDESATVHEKLLEGLVQRFEAYNDKRPALQTIARACPGHPALAMMLSANLYHYIDRLLYICGDTEQSFRRMARIKGVCAVAVKAGASWQRDDSPDLSRTMKVLDRDLKTAAEWAVSLRLLSVQEGEAEEDDHL